MKQLSVEEIKKSINANLVSGNEQGWVRGVSTDSRTVTSDDIFFALSGEKFDGHDYVNQVIDKGCRNIVISQKSGITDSREANFFLVEDTLKAYQNLAKYYKELIAPITIGVTGSVGKTSLKDMLFIISEDHFNTVCSKENENNEIGVPKTIFGMEENTEVLILEMGMRGKEEISLLADIGRPDIGAITNIGVSHLEKFPNQDGIFHAKMEITDYFTSVNTLVILGDDKFLKAIKGNKKYNVLSAGFEEGNDYVVSGAKYLDDRDITFLIEYDNGVERFTLPVAGLYNSTTAGLATAIMSKLNISPSQCNRSLKKLKMTPHRLQLIDTGHLKIIDDTYNASPASMSSAIEYLKAIESDRKVAVLGDMKELGEKNWKTLHRQVGEEVGQADIDYVFTVGDLAREIADAAGEKMNGENVMSFEDNKACVNHIKQILKKGDGILVKGSNSMNMVEVVHTLEGI